MTELDDLLRSSLQRLAEPGDTAGVLDAIRVKLEAAGPAGPGGGGASGMSGLAGTGIVAAVAIGASALGAGLGWSAGASDEPAPAETAAVVQAAPMHGVPAAACPGGAAVTELDPGARVLALARSEDGAYLAVRDPASLGTLVWVAADAAVVDPGQDVLGLEARSCADGSPIPASPSPEPTPAPAPVPEPGPQPGPAPAPNPGPAPVPADTTKPTLQVGIWTESYLCTVESGMGPMASSITVVVGDNVGVTSVQASTNAPGVSIGGPAGSGSNRTFTVTRSGNTDAVIVVTFTVKDAAGNTQTGSSTNLPSYSPGNCLG